MNTKIKEFYRRLADLLDEFDVDLDATHDQSPYGAHRPLIDVQFNDPYHSDEVVTLSADDARAMAGEK